MSDKPQDGHRHLMWRAFAVFSGLLAAGVIAFVAAPHQNQDTGQSTLANTVVNVVTTDAAATSAAAPNRDGHPPDAGADNAVAARQEQVKAASARPVDEADHGAQREAIDEALSRSIGTPQNGHLQGGVDLAAQPRAAIRILAATRKRGFTVGTAELIALLQDIATAISAAYPNSTLAIGNLSRPGGGDIGQSVSHNSGRDVDIAFFATQESSAIIRLDRMHHFDDEGVANVAGTGPVRFDVARNWALVRHLLSHPAVVVQWIFIAAPLRNMLLDHALRTDEPELLQARARRVMVQPNDSSKHDDHFHVRIACPAGDRPACIDGGGRTKIARDAQIDALLQMYHRGSPAEQRYARDMLSLPISGQDLQLPPLETP